MGMMGDKMPERIWAGDYVGIVGLPSPIWFEDEGNLSNSGDLARMARYLKSTPVLEHAEEMRELIDDYLKYDGTLGIYDAHKCHEARLKIISLFTTIAAAEAGEGEG